MAYPFRDGLCRRWHEFYHSKDTPSFSFWQLDPQLLIITPAKRRRLQAVLAAARQTYRSY
jgi:hypothetical protein